MGETAEDYAAGKLYEPHGAVRELFRCKSPEVLIEGPAGTGKTRGVLEKVFLLAMKYAGSRHLILRATRKSMTESVLVTFQEKVVPAQHPCLQGPQRNLRGSYRLPNGSEIIVGGLDNADKIMSTEYDTISVFEATETREGDVEQLTTRLRNNVMPYQQLICDCNPSYPKHWLNKRARGSQMVRLVSRHEDNPTLWDGKGWTQAGEKYVNGILGGLSGVRKLRLKAGKWAKSEGMVYSDFSADTHMIDRADPPEGVAKYRVIDFGYTNPFVCQWWYLDHDGRAVMYREIYHSQRLVSRHAQQINDLSEGETYVATIADHDAEDRATLAEAGIHTLPACKAVSRGIQAVQDRMSIAKDGKPRLYFMRDALVEEDANLREAHKPTCTEDEVDGYSWPESKDGKEEKEAPVKVDDHGMDAMRYLVAHVDQIKAGAGVVTGGISVSAPKNELERILAEV
jgi:PBSX family phage terminase large subunit